MRECSTDGCHNVPDVDTSGRHFASCRGCKFGEWSGLTPPAGMVETSAERMAREAAREARHEAQAANDTARWLERLAADPDDDTTEAETARSAATEAQAEAETARSAATEAQAEADRLTEATRTSTVETL